MLTAQETDQLVNDIQREFPMFSVGERRDPSSRAFVVIVRDPKGQNEISITSLQGDWRGDVAAMVALHKPTGEKTGP
jgi:hypothetical protein